MIKNKKAIAVLLLVAMLFSIMPTAVFAEENSCPASPITAYVTIVNQEGELVVTHQAIAVNDNNENGYTDIDDVLYIVHAEFYTGGAVAGYALSGRKFNLFLEYKDRINEYLKNKNNDEEVVDTNTNNPVVKPKKVKNLCINDVNFMTYRQIKKITKAIDKVEAEEEKCEALGIDREKVYTKTRKF